MRVPWIAREIKPINPKGNQPSIFIGRTDTEAPVLWPANAKANSLETTVMLGKIEGKRIRRWQRIRQLDSITDSMDRSLARRWTTEPDVLQSMDSKRVRHDLGTEEQQSTYLLLQGLNHVLL